MTDVRLPDGCPRCWADRFRPAGENGFLECCACGLRVKGFEVKVEQKESETINLDEEDTWPGGVRFFFQHNTWEEGDLC